MFSLSSLVGFWGGFFVGFSSLCGLTYGQIVRVTTQRSFGAEGRSGTGLSYEEWNPDDMIASILCELREMRDAA